MTDIGLQKTILVVTGTRAEYGILRSSMDAIIAHPSLTLRLLVTGTHTLRSLGNTKAQIQKDGYHIDALVPIKEKDGQLAALQKEIAGIEKYCERNRPDCILVLGDRDEPLAAAIVAMHLNIPIAHIHGGDVTGPGVDETIRQAISKMAHIHFPATEQSAARIHALGEEDWRINVVGAPGLDMLGKEARLAKEAIASELKLDAAKPWLLAVQHPTAFDETPLQEQITSVCAALESFPEYEKIVLYPNNDTGSDLFIETLKKLPSSYHVFASLPREVYVGALAASDVLIGNSSSGIIEAAYLGTPTIDVGNRQRGRDHGASVIHVAYSASEIVDAVREAMVLKHEQKGESFPSPYGMGNAGQQIAERLAQLLSEPRLLQKQLVMRD